MFYCFGQFNNPFMMINPYMFMSATGIGTTMPQNYGVPYNSMINTGITSTPYFGGFTGLGTSIFAGNPIYQQMALGSIFPIFPMINTLQQTVQTAGRVGGMLSNVDFGNLFGFLKPKTQATDTTESTSTTSKTGTESADGSSQTVDAAAPKTTTEVQSSHANGKSRPAAGKKLGKDFLNAVKGVAQRINCDYRDLLAVMNGESGLNPQAVNPNGGATGLIQFMPKTAKGLGTTTEALKNMSAIEQLTYVEKFYTRMKKAAGFAASDRLTAGDLYAITFLPARAKREVLCEKGEGNRYYECNSGTDLNKDGKITKSELAQRVERRRVDESIFA